jgi:hypothetical protein
MTFALKRRPLRGPARRDMTMADNESDREMNRILRVCLVVAGLALAGASARLYWCPPTRDTFAPQCAGAGCHGVVAANPDAYAGTLAVLGVLLFVVGLNGRRLTGIQLPGVAANMAQKAGLVAATLGKKTPGPRGVAPAPTTGAAPLGKADGFVEVDGTVLGIYSEEAVPGQVLAGAVAKILAAGKVSASCGPLQFAACAVGTPDPVWFVKFADQPVAWRVEHDPSGTNQVKVTELT